MSVGLDWIGWIYLRTLLLLEHLAVLKIIPQFQQEEGRNMEERLGLVFEARVEVEGGRRAKEATVSDHNVVNTIL